MKRISVLAAAALLLSLVSPTAQAQVLFQDDFQSDTAGTTSSTADLDPVIGTGDVGGTWTINEFGANYLQVLNDTVPGNNIAGSDNYVSIVRTTTASRSGGAYGTGWTTSLTLNQVVQLDFNVWQGPPFATGANDLGVVFLSQAPPSGPSNFDYNNYASAWTDMVFTDQTWHSVRIRANFDSSVTQFGIAPQTFTLSIDSGTPTTGSFFTTQNSVETIGFYGGGNNSTMYFNDVVLQVVPEPSSLGLLAVGMGALLLVRRIRKA